MSSPNPDLTARLEALEGVEGKISELMKHAQAALNELSKDKQISKTKMEESSSQFRNTLQAVEKELSSQMHYLSHVCVGSAHQGSTFASQQNMDLAAAAGQQLSDQLADIAAVHFADSADDK